MASIRDKLTRAHDALEGMSDSDLDHFETDEEEIEGAPAQYAARTIFSAVQEIDAALAAHPAPSSDAANLHKIDAAVSLLRVASGIAADKITPASLRRQVVESVVNAGGANGAGDEYIFADVYEQICEMMGPHVGADGSGLPASVVESYQFLLEFWIAAHPANGAQVGEPEVKKPTGDQTAPGGTTATTATTDGSHATKTASAWGDAGAQAGLSDEEISCILEKTRSHNVFEFNVWPLQFARAILAATKKGGQDA